MFSQPFFIPAVLILLFSIPLVLGLIPQNRIYGIRTIKTLADKDLWYTANRYGGWALLISSLFYLAIAAILPSTVSGNTDFGKWVLHLAAFALPLVISLSLLRRYLK